MQAQQVPMYSQYMFNSFILNPAAAGSDGYSSFNLTSRQQWLGIQNAPRTNSLSFQTRILKRSYIIKRDPLKLKNSFIPSRTGRVGLGATIMNDRTGLFNRTSLQLTYAYHIFLNNTQISFGLTGKAIQFKLDLTDQDVNSALPGGLTVGDLRKPVYTPDADFGFYVLNERYYAGFSVENLLQSYIKVGNQELKDYRLRRTYYLTGAYRKISESDYDFEPSILLKMTEKLAWQADFSFKVYYRENYWLGLSFRTDKDLILYGGLRYNKMYFGYAFDYGFSNLTRYTYGSHEFVMAYKLGDNARRFRWLIRY
jgi:type IX secretion system PorP/SprF family membrane protein